MNRIDINSIIASDKLEKAKDHCERKVLDGYDSPLADTFEGQAHIIESAGDPSAEDHRLCLDYLFNRGFGILLKMANTGLFSGRMFSLLSNPITYEEIYDFLVYAYAYLGNESKELELLYNEDQPVPNAHKYFSPEKFNPEKTPDLLGKFLYSANLLAVDKWRNFRNRKKSQRRKLRKMGSASFGDRDYVLAVSKDEDDYGQESYSTEIGVFDPDPEEYERETYENSEREDKLERIRESLLGDSDLLGFLDDIRWNKLSMQELKKKYSLSTAQYNDMFRKIANLAKESGITS